MYAVVILGLSALALAAWALPSLADFLRRRVP